MTELPEGAVADQQHLALRHGDIADRLTRLIGESAVDTHDKDVLRAYQAYIVDEASRMDAPVKVAFVAAVGCGKSTLISAATNLRLSDGNDPQEWAVLPVGDGRTTLGELRVIPELRDDVALHVEPIDESTMRLELQRFAEDTWAEAKGQPSGSTGDGIGEELHKLFRGWLAGSVPERDVHLRDWVRAFETPEACFDATVDRVNIKERLAALSSVFPATQDGLHELQKTLGLLMEGGLWPAPAPRCTTLRIPRTMCAAPVGELIDTQGVEHDVTPRLLKARPDLNALFGDPDVAFVVCTPFNTAPDVVSEGLVKELRAGGSAPRPVRLLLVDNRATTSGPKAENARAERLALSVRKLRGQGELRDLPDDFAVAVDARREPEALTSICSELTNSILYERRANWQKALDIAEHVLAEHADTERRTQARAEAIHLRWLWETSWEQTSRVSIGPLRLLAQLIRERDPFIVAHWSHVRATMRRRGRYGKLDLAELGAAEAASHAMSSVKTALRLMRSALNQRAALAPQAPKRQQQSLTLLRLKLSAFANQIEWRQQDLHRKWRDDLREFFASESAAGLWERGQARWGRGPGYLDDIAALFEEEARRAPPHIRENRPEEVRPAWLAAQPPPQLFIHTVELKNFRCVESGTMTLSKTTALVADNGGGKTAWLEGIAAGLGALLPGLGAGDPPPMGARDVRQAIRSLAGVPDQQRYHPLKITLTGELEGSTQTWARAIEEGETEVPAGPTGARLISEQIGAEVRATISRPLPVIAYYSTQRLWPQGLDGGDREVGNRQEGYRDCLSATPTHRHMLAWVRDFTLAGLQQGRSFPQLLAIEAAVVECVPGAVHFYYDVASKRLQIELSDGQHVPFSLLSDGYRNLVALVADIAWRASVLNPELGARAPKLAEGVVLIDEIDLHLHPKWQRRVMGDLRRAFPKLQIIVTTHSPQVIASVEPESVRILRADGTVGRASHTLGRDSNPLLEDVVEDGAHPAWVYKDVDRAKAAMQEGRLSEAGALIDDLERKLDASSMLVRSLRWQLLDDFAPGEE
jgi:predicted ATP-binding protein involved in virulence